MKTSRLVLLLAAALLTAACGTSDPTAPAVRKVPSAPRATVAPTDTIPPDPNRTPFMGGSAG